MKALCEFVRVESADERVQWRCAVCGHITPIPLPKPPHRNCDVQDGRTQAAKTKTDQALAWLICPHRGDVLATVPARTAGIGCETTVVEVYQCDHFREPALKQAAARCLPRIREAAPGYTGRTCRECEVPRAGGEPETLQTTPPAPQTIGVVVTSHNYGRYLSECLDSILSQTEQAAAVVLVDDSSTDDTPTVAARYAGRVRYMRTECRDVAKARNAGIAACGQVAYLCCVDADDVLPPNYLQTLRAGMTDPRIGVTYPQCERFDDADKSHGRSPWIVPYNRDLLQRQNFACATSLVRRQALEQVGGWESNRYGLQDWHLWLRITAAGWTMRLCDQTALRYRQHAGSMTDLRRGNWDCVADVMAEAQLTALVTLFAGREWMLDRWFGHLVELDWPRQNLHLVAVDNSRDNAFSRTLRAKLDQCGITYTHVRDDRRIVETATAAEVGATAALRREHVYAMGVHLARLYSTATRYLPAAANVFSIEDDVGIQPNALRTLAAEFARTQAAAVSGCLKSRFGNRTIAWNGRQSITKASDGTIEIDKTGFFCLLTSRRIWDAIAWRPGTTGTNQYPYYDWAACEDIRRHGKIHLVGQVRCRHYQPDGSVLMP